MINYIYNSYKFSKSFKFFFFQKNCNIIIQRNSRFFFLNLPFLYFLKKNKTLISFIFLNYFHFITFVKHVSQMYNKLFSFYFFRLKLKGLGYRIVHLSTFLLKVFFNRSNFFYIHLSSSILFKYKIRRLFFLSTNIEHLRVSMIHILLLKKYIVYRLSGLFYPRQILILKPGKNKFR